jgi:hypothetical protein
MSSIQVTYLSSGNEVRVERSFTASPFRFQREKPTEAIFRKGIAGATGKERDVLHDLYRWLVLSNFAKLNGKGGKSAKPELDQLYPDKGCLPHFAVVSGRYNTTGAILHNLDSHPSQEGGYALLPGFLLGLMKVGLDAPRCDVSSSD